MNETLDLSLYATPAGNGTFGMELAIDGIACGACIARVEGAVKQVPGVTEARLNFTNRRLHVAWADGAVKPAEILQALEASGYHGHPFIPLRAEQEEAARGTPAHTVSGGGWLRHHEHHAAFGIGLVWQCHRHHAGDA